VRARPYGLGKRGVGVALCYPTPRWSSFSVAGVATLGADMSGIAEVAFTVCFAMRLASWIAGSYAYARRR